MVSSKQKQKMIEYITENLRLAGHHAIPQSKELINNQKSNYIIVDSQKSLFLVDKIYPSIKNTHNRFTSRLKIIENILHLNNMNEVGFVFYKDGINFFRNIAKDKSWKKYDYALKEYNKTGNKYNIIEGLDPIQRMIMLRNEEKFGLKKNESKIRVIQYFQPNSSRLDEKIISFKFRPVEYDYSHKTQSEINHGFKPQNQNSAKIYEWYKKFENDGAIHFNDGLLFKKKT